MKKSIIVCVLLAVLLVSGCSNVNLTIGDPCKIEFDECNYECGEGWLSELCKTRCTIEYNECD